jgi:hypothetical protein
MEVHAHSHTPRKKWTHFVWEFIMLFLAVFCGFLAEYQLEHMIEKNREKEYISALVKDLRYDTAQFRSTISRLKRKIPNYDSVLQFLKDPEASSKKLPFRFYIKTNLEIIYTPLEPTLQQLKGSGNFRLIHNKLVLDSILIYDSKINGEFMKQNTYVVEFNKKLIDYQEKVFDDMNFNNFLNDEFNGAEERSGDYDVTLFTKDKEKIMALANLYIDAKATDVFYINTLKRRITEAEELISLIKREYHLE